MGSSRYTLRLPRKTLNSGAVVGIIPSASCEAATMSSIRPAYAWISYPRARGSYTRWSRSSQPDFSRCGQSVSTEYMLLWIARSMMPWIALKSSDDDWNEPTASLSARMTSASRSDAGGGCVRLSTCIYRKPWYMNRGAYHSDDERPMNV